MAVKERRAQVAQNPRRLPMWAQTTLRVFEGPAAKLGLVLLIIMLILCLGAPLFTHYSINDMDLLNMHAGPSKEHLLGTDRMGRDLWTLLLYGGRTSIALGILGSLFAAVGGTVVGLVSGYLGGQADNLIMRFCDVWSAIPRNAALYAGGLRAGQRFLQHHRGPGHRRHPQRGADDARADPL